MEKLTPDLIRELIPKIGMRVKFINKWKAQFRTELKDVNVSIKYKEIDY